MSVTYKDAMQFISDEIERCVATNFANQTPESVQFMTRKIEVLEKVREVIDGREEEFDPELHKFSMIAIRDVRYSREFVVEARDKYEAKEKLEQCFNDGCFYLDSSECECDESEFSIVDINVFDGEPYGCEVSDEGVWEN